jgi:DNA topoisomerase I
MTLSATRGANRKPARVGHLRHGAKKPAPHHVAKHAGLRYVDSNEPGIRRVKHGNGFIYRNPDGSRVTSPRELERIRALALPPAWRDVWICTSARGHLLATGIDARGRKQYRYHPDWNRVRDEAKYNELAAFGERLPALRRKLAHDLALPGLPREKVLAAVISVMAQTAARVGNERYVAENGSFGLTTLLDRHARIGGTELKLEFKGKGGKPYRARVADRKLAAIVKRCRDIPGQRLFQYAAKDGSYHAITSGDVNRYLKRATGLEITAKTFRTWTATLLAARELSGLEAAASERAGKRQINQMLALVADRLGNTPAICRKSYVDPRVIDAHLKQQLRRCSGNTTRRSGLRPEECRLLAILRVGPTAPRKAA